MTVQTIDQKINADRNSSIFEFLINGKKKLLVMINDSYINTLNVNASHKAFRRMGKFSPTVEAALESYKCEGIRDAILEAVRITNEELPGATVAAAYKGEEVPA